MDTRNHRSNILAWVTAIACIGGFALALGACDYDRYDSNPPGHTKSVHKESTIGPDGQRETITTTHERKTEVYPK